MLFILQYPAKKYSKYGKYNTVIHTLNVHLTPISIGSCQALLSLCRPRQPHQGETSDRESFENKLHSQFKHKHQAYKAYNKTLNKIILRHFLTYWTILDVAILPNLALQLISIKYKLLLVLSYTSLNSLLEKSHRRDV